MVDRDTLVELAPHYVALLVLMLLVTFVMRATVGDLGFWIELGVLILVVVAYRPVVLRLGVAPSAWQDR